MCFPSWSFQRMATNKWPILTRWVILWPLASSCSAYGTSSLNTFTGSPTRLGLGSWISVMVTQKKIITCNMEEGWETETKRDRRTKTGRKVAYMIVENWYSKICLIDLQNSSVCIWQCKPSDPNLILGFLRTRRKPDPQFWTVTSTCSPCYAHITIHAQ